MGLRQSCNPLISLVAGRGFEPLIFGFMTQRFENLISIEFNDTHFFLYNARLD